MIQPTLNYVTCPDSAGSHRMAYWQWGDPASAHVVLCAHGLTRQGRDFDELARALCERASDTGVSLRVICPDVVGRGQSDWLKDPAGYQVPAYVSDMLVLLAKLQSEAAIDVLDWVGTSMGGLIGLVICGQADLPLPQRVRKLVLNDVGPTLEWSALQRIGTYLGKGGEFESLQQAADAMWVISSSFGPHTPEQWLALSTPMVRPVDDADTSAPKRWKLHYDPSIAVPFTAGTQASTLESQAMLWRLYDQISADTLLLRGVESDLLSAETAKAMTERGPHARLVQFKGVGHAPTITSADQVEVVADFLWASHDQ
jgi:pimeloyl-ACP methyl ester carboxylesterase